MAKLREFIIQNIRCFREEQRVPLRPITLLVGENSTGKTTFLGCYRVLHNLAKMQIDNRGPNFNDAPFLMGAFHDIVHRAKSGKKIGNDFKLGMEFEYQNRRKSNGCEFVYSFAESGSEPAISHIALSFKDNDARSSHEKERMLVSSLDSRKCDNVLSFQKREGETWNVTGPGFDFPLDRWTKSGTFWETFFSMERLDFFLAPQQGEKSKESQKNHRKFHDFVRLHLPQTERRLRRPLDLDIFEMIPDLGGLFSTAPIRSEPKRTYDPVSEIAKPTGEHIPMLMARMFRDSSSSWKELRERLVEFGNESGMFSEVKIKSHGKHISDPFQIQVKARGPIANIVDVGYGVSQVLPIVAEILSTKERRQFLLQQPEVHLHPRGQAALASFFAEAAKKHSFIIETHSDYIVDRIRICVRKKELRPDDVALLFFNPSRNGVDICRVELGEQGELLNPPKGYGDFFVRESDQLLGFED